MNRPVILDLFCGAGGAAMGYHRAGFDVVGVDINPQPNYPFEFYRADALEALECLPFFDAIHASPPCQRYSQATNMHDKTKHPDLVGPVREALIRRGVPYVIENVPGAPLLDPVMLCGSMWGIERLRRHRLFESSFWMPQPECDHSFQYDLLSVTGHGEGGSHRDGGKRGPYWGQAERREVMGIHWMNRRELAESIPPIFTAWVGRHLLNSVNAEAAA